jgi:hypothetical protein
MNISPGIRALEEPIIKHKSNENENTSSTPGKIEFPNDYCNHLLLRKTEDATGFGLVREKNKKP